MGGNNYVPAPDAAFDPFFNNIRQYVNNKCMLDAPEWTT
jgi:hypothetical protein